MKLLMPLLAVSACYVATTASTSHYEAVGRLSSDALFTAAQRQVQMRRCHVMLQRCVRDKNAAACEDSGACVAEFQRLHDVLAHGAGSSISGGLKSAHSGLRALYHASACPVTAPQPECDTFQYGIMLQGLHSAALWWADRAVATVASQDEATLRLLDTVTPWLLLSMEDAAAMRRDETGGMLRDQAAFLQVILVLVTLAMAAFIIFSRRVLSAESAQTRDALACLVLLPDGLLRELPAVREFVMATSSGLGGFSRTSVTPL